MKNDRSDFLLKVISDEAQDEFHSHVKTEFLDMAMKALVCSDEFAEMDKERKKEIYDYYERLAIIIDAMEHYINNKTLEPVEK